MDLSMLMTILYGHEYNSLNTRMSHINSSLLSSNKCKIKKVFELQQLVVIIVVNLKTNILKTYEKRIKF